MSNSTICCDHQIPNDLMTLMEAGAFQSLVSHLKERSDDVQNLDLMTISGFCRNCLAKWLVLEARKISSQRKVGLDNYTDASKKDDEEEERRLIQTLDSFGYDDAAKLVYGCEYSDWKKRHARKATDEQMKKYKESSSIHAKHDKSLLAVKADKPETPPTSQIDKNDQSQQVNPSSSSLLSNVCCDNNSSIINSNNASKPKPSQLSKKKLKYPSPPNNGVTLRVGILTISDRASANEYETGDLSGPAVISALANMAEEMNKHYENPFLINYNIIQKAIIPDEHHTIARVLNKWSGKNNTYSPTQTRDDTKMKNENNVDEENKNEDEDNEKISPCNLILTTGGTGFAPRDVTPEATLSILDRECRGLMSWCSIECASEQPLAPLSRGTAGICKQTMIANLPGNPKGVEEVLKVVFPLLIHAVKDLEK